MDRLQAPVVALTTTPSSVPTLILHRLDERPLPAEGPCCTAAQIAGVELIAEAAPRARPGAATPERDRFLATVVATQILDAARTAFRLGDQRWGEVRAAFDAGIEQAIARHHGHEVSRTLDGIVAAFASPVRAIQAADEMITVARQLGLRARGGLHAGEVVVAGNALDGLAVHLAARVAAQADAGSIFVSGLVRELVAGGDVEFASAGDRVFAGLPGEWRLFQVIRVAAAATTRDAIADESTEPDARPTPSLSPREREIATVVALGLSNRQVANELTITVATVERHIANIFDKLGFHSRAQIAAWAVAHGLLRSPAD